MGVDDVASNICQALPRPTAGPAAPSGLADIACHVIQSISNPRFLSYMASYDAASSICQSLLRGAGKH